MCVCTGLLCSFWFEEFEFVCRFVFCCSLCFVLQKQSSAQRNCCKSIPKQLFQKPSMQTVQKSSAKKNANDPYGFLCTCTLIFTHIHWGMPKSWFNVGKLSSQKYSPGRKKWTFTKVLWFLDPIYTLIHVVFCSYMGTINH